MAWLPGLAPALGSGDVHDGSGDRWMTPPLYLDPIVDTLGDRWIDPCADPASPISARASAVLDIRNGDDGLAGAWPDGPAFVNPPYSDASAWIDRCAAESAKGRAVLALVPIRPEGNAWHRSIWSSAQVVIPRGRIKFTGSDGETHGSAMIGTAFVCWTCDGHTLHASLERKGIASVVVGKLE